MWFQFFLQNLHFAANLFSSLVFFAVCWLHFDAWQATKSRRDMVKAIGFFLLSASFFLHALVVEAIGFASPLLSPELLSSLVLTSRLTGFTFLLVAIASNPLQNRPVLPLLFLPSAFPVELFSFLLALAVSLLFLRRATRDLEHHLLPLFWGFLILSLSELFSAAAALRSNSNPDLFSQVTAFGPVWIIEHLLLLTACLIIGRWVFHYLLKRLFSQLFIILTTTTLAIFVTTAVSFTALLLKSLEDQTLEQIATSAKVLNVALDSKRREIVSVTSTLATHPDVVRSASTSAKLHLSALAQDRLVQSGLSFLVIVDSSGRILARGEDASATADSLQSDPLVSPALSGTPVSSVVVHEGPLSPQVSLAAAAPVSSATGQVTGAVVTSIVLDSAFLDGIKSATGLDATIYAGNVLSATTLSTPDGSSTPVGTKEETPEIKRRVLFEGRNYSGPHTLLNTPHLASFVPITDADRVPVAMLSVTYPQSQLFSTASRSIQVTFVTAAVLIVLSVIPTLLITRYLTRQIQ